MMGALFMVSILWIVHGLHLVVGIFLTMTVDKSLIEKGDDDADSCGDGDGDGGSTMNEVHDGVCDYPPVNLDEDVRSISESEKNLHN